MFDIGKHTQSLLSSLEIPCYNEHFVDSNVTLPACSWLLINDASQYVGDTMDFSQITLRVSVWATSQAELHQWCNTVNALLESNGYRRLSTTFLPLPNGVIKNAMSYRCIAKENK